MPLRVMVTGETQTPSIDATLELIGREEVLGAIHAELAAFSGLNFVYSHRSRRYNSRLFCGGIAQLGERLHGMQEVSGSIPLTSTN